MNEPINSNDIQNRGYLHRHDCQEIKLTTIIGNMTGFICTHLAGVNRKFRSWTVIYWSVYASLLDGITMKY